MKMSFSEAYKYVNEKVGDKQERQKELYNRKIHGEPYKAGDMVWLLNPAVPKGKAKKFHNPWTGPYKVTDRLSAVTYKIQNTLNHRFSVVHFDQLKVCPPNIRIPQNVPKASEATGLPVELPPAAAPGTHAELVEEDESKMQWKNYQHQYHVDILTV